MKKKKKIRAKEVVSCIGMAIALLGIAVIENIPLGFSLMIAGVAIIGLAHVHLPHIRIYIETVRR